MREPLTANLKVVTGKREKKGKKGKKAGLVGARLDGEIEGCSCTKYERRIQC